MKTIFDKINPKYIECSTGVCEHTHHAPNMIYIGIITVMATYLVLKFSKTIHN